MDENLLTFLRKIAFDPKTVQAALPLLRRYGGTGLLALARGYLGPLAQQASTCQSDHAGTPPPPNTPSATGGDEGAAASAPPGRDAASDTAILGLALSKLLFELGEVALHNPTLDPGGKQPQFQLDANGCPPAMSVTHVLAATRWWRQNSARRAADNQAQQTATALAQNRSSRALLQAARSERYAASSRYSYVAPVATYRGPR